MSLEIYKDTNFHHKNLDVVKMGIIGLTNYGLHLCIERENHDTKIDDIIELINAIEGFYDIENYSQGKQPIKILEDVYNTRKIMNKTDSILKPKGFNNFMMSAIVEIKSLDLVLPTEIGNNFTETMVTGLFMFGCGEIYDVPSTKFTAKIINYMQEIPAYWGNKCEDVDQYIVFLNKAVLEMRMKYANEYEQDICQEQLEESEPKWEMKM